jgi:outer membrane autotransporter protein
VTTAEDAAVAPPPQSLRAEIAAAAPDAVIPIQIPTGGDSSSIDLADSLIFSRSVTIDNADPAFELFPIQAPEVGSFLEIGSDVTLTLRDVVLLSNPDNPDAAIDLQSATSVLVVAPGREDQTIDADLVGAGSLVKQGSAALDLRGVNSFSGGIRVEEGDLIGDVVSLATVGMGNITLAPNAAGTTARIVFDIGEAGDDLAVDGPSFLADVTSGGSAVFVKRGAGALGIAAASTAAGIDFEIENGELAVGAGNLANDPDFTIRSDGALRIISSDSADSFDGRLFGTGDVILSPLVDLILTNDQSDFQGRMVANGSLIVLRASPSQDLKLDFDTEIQFASVPDIPVLVPAVFTIDNSSGFEIELAGDITGTGFFRKAGPGRIRLTGTATHTGGTFVDQGILIGDTRNLQRTITMTPNTGLHFDQQVDGTFGGTIVNGAGMITVKKLGSGTLTLGTSQPFTGRFEIDDGGLVFANGVDLTNADLVIGNDDANRATLSTPFLSGGSQGANTVHIGGNLTLNDDARVLVTLSDRDENGNPAARSTRFAAGGSVTIGSGASPGAPELVVGLAPGGFTDPTQRTFTLFTGAAGVNVVDDFVVEDDLFFFDLNPLGNSVDPNAYQIELQDSGATLANAGTTPNRRAVGRALDELRANGPGGDPQLEDLLGNLNVLTNDDVDGALDGAAADSLAAATNIRLAAAARTWRSISNRLALARGRSIGHHDRRAKRQASKRRDLRARQRGMLPDPADRPGVESGVSTDGSTAAANGTADDPAGPWVAWLEGSGLIGEIDSDDAAGYDYRLVGPILGADRALGEKVRFGFATSATHATYEADGSGNEGDLTSVEGAVYAAWVGAPIEILLGARYGHSWVETERRTRIEQFNGRADGDFEGDEYGAYAELTRAFGTPSKIEFAPFVRTAYTRIDFDDFDEDGRNPIRMEVDGDEIDSLVSSVGIRLALEREMDEGFVFRPRLEASWGREWGDRDRPIQGRFAAGTTPIELEGAELPRDRAQISVGWEIGYNANANLFIGWDGRFGEDLVENALSLGVRAAW